jgi:hypothetical protein
VIGFLAVFLYLLLCYAWMATASQGLAVFVLTTVCMLSVSYFFMQSTKDEIAEGFYWVMAAGVTVLGALCCAGKVALKVFGE